MHSAHELDAATIFGAAAARTRPGRPELCSVRSCTPISSAISPSESSPAGAARLPPARDDRPATAPRPAARRAWSDDQLINIEPAIYVTELIGRPPGRNHKISCPFHEDRTPSLHVFPTPQRGWCC